MKKNTMMVFAILSLYRATKKDFYKKSFYKWFDGFKNYFVRKDGSFYDFFDPLKSVSYETTLTKNNSLIEVLFDAYNIFNDNQFLVMAKNCCDIWISKQGKTSLFPERIHIDRIYPLDWRMMLDANTDFGVNLLKLYELSGEKKYLLLADELLTSIFKFNKTTNGYILYVNYESGEPIGLRSFFVKTKFNTLFLKLVLCMIEVRSGKKIFKDKLFWSLSRDR